MTTFKVGDTVVVVDDSDVPFSGVVGTVVEVGVETMGGPGLMFESAEFGKMKGSYDCFARVQ